MCCQLEVCLETMVSVYTQMLSFSYEDSIYIYSLVCETVLIASYYDVYNIANCSHLWCLILLLYNIFMSLSMNILLLAKLVGFCNAIGLKLALCY